MKKSRPGRAIVALTVILIASAAAVAFIKSSDKKRTDWTQYYWYDASGSYLGRQWTVNEEMDFTGYDDDPYAPNTLREKGYAPSVVTGDDPPVPNNPYNPTIKLYSHP
jgi:hypothetical protein